MVTSIEGDKEYCTDWLCLHGINSKEEILKHVEDFYNKKFEEGWERETEILKESGNYVVIFRRQ